MAFVPRGHTRPPTVLATFGLILGVVALGQTPARAAVPAIASFTPASGGVGTPVAISGSGFVDVTGVEFDGVEAVFMVPSSTSIETSVPVGAFSGPISVTASGVTAASENDFVVLGVLALSPSSGPPTARIEASGSGFKPGETVRLSFGATSVGQAVADANGAFSGTDLRVPVSATPGSHRVSSLGAESGVRAKASFLVRTDWPQYRGGPAHMGLNPYENVLSVANARRLGRVWSFATGDEVNGSPTVVGGVLYVGSQDGDLNALDASTGALLWSDTIGGNDTPAVADGVVYAASGELYAVDAASGDQLWTTSDGGYRQNPTVADGLVYAVSYEGTIAAFDASTGAPVWSRSIDENIDWSTPAVVGGSLYVGSIDGSRGRVYALDASTGATRWTKRTPGYIQSSPAVVHGVVYVGSSGGGLYALNASTGARVWKTESRGFDSSPAVAHGVVFVGSEFGDVDAYRASTGALLWRFNAVAGGPDVDSSPTVANGVVYVGSDTGTVYALDASTGRELWSFRTGRGIWSAPTVVDGMVFVGGRDGTIYAFGLH